MSIDELFEVNGRLESLVIGALKSAIDAHGSITQALKSSAARRVTSQLRGFLRQHSLIDIRDASIRSEHRRLEKENERLHLKMISQAKQVMDLVGKLEKSDEG